MSNGTKNENLMKIKIKIAEKYERLAKVTPSRPKRNRMLRHAKCYRRQAELLSQ